MALQVSTMFKTLLLGGASFKDIFDGGAIKIFSGAQPATADAEETGTYLGLITLNGGDWTFGDETNGLVFDQSGPFIVKPTGASWIFTGVDTGAMGWYRLIGNAEDDGTARLDLPRIDGAIATSNAELVLPSLAVTPGQNNTLQQFLFTFPPVPGL